MILPENRCDQGPPGTDNRAGGTAAQMMAQSAIAVPDGFALDGSDPSPAARAIVQGLALARG